MNKTTLLLLALTALAGCQTTGDEPAWTELFDGESLNGWEATRFGGEGDVIVQDGSLEMDIGSPLTGVTLRASPPTNDYELEVIAARIEGTDFFCGLTFPVGEDHLTLVLGGWGGSVCGLSCLDGADASDNVTRTLRGFEDGRDYTVTVRVTDDAVTVLLDDELLTQIKRADHEFALRTEVEPSVPLGLASFSTRARIKAVRWRPIDAD